MTSAEIELWEALKKAGLVDALEEIVRRALLEEHRKGVEAGIKVAAVRLREASGKHYAEDIDDTAAVYRGAAKFLEGSLVDERYPLDRSDRVYRSASKIGV